MASILFPGFHYGYGTTSGGGVSADAAISAARSASRAEAAEREVEQLNDRLDKLTLVCMAMWSLLREVSDLREEDLMQRVREIDLRDGVPDGKVTRRIARCPRCNRVMSPRHKKCLYCGSPRLDLTAFDQAL